MALFQPSTIFIAGLLLLTSCRAATDRGGGAAQTEERPKSSLAQRPCLNLNTASAEELMGLPAVGEVLARRIITYREQHGPLRRTQEIIIIDGFSERKYKAIAELVCVE